MTYLGLPFAYLPARVRVTLLFFFSGADDDGLVVLVDSVPSFSFSRGAS